MYQILFDYRSEGHSFLTDKDGPLQFGSVDAAVKHALDLGYSSPFLIVQVIDWEATAKSPTT